jgi:threonine/homoserine/homoserine lactone efflux protein
VLVFLIQGLALGINAAAAPGLFQTFLINQTLSGGWKRGAPVAFAPLISDIPIVTVILLLLNRLPGGFIRAIGIVGGIFAFYLAWGLWRQWRTSPQTTVADSAALQPGGLWKGVLMNALSPGPYTFWTLVNGPLLLRALDISFPHAAAFLTGFYGAFIGGMLLLVGIFHQARRVGPRLVRALSLLSILILVIFGGILIANGLRGS